MKIRTLLLISTGALAALLAWPQDFPQSQPGPINGPQGQAPGADVPGRAARLSLLEGTVSYQPGSVDDWVPAELNRPLTTGDRLWTEAGSRVEVNLGSSVMRLNARTNFSFINLDDHIAQMQLSLGSMSVRVRRLTDDEVVEVDTPQVALSLLRPGEYRIDVNEQGDTTVVSVRSGQAEATAGQAFTIQPRQQVRIIGAGESGTPTFDQRDMPPADQFDVWCQSRDRREDMSQSSKYVSRDTPGYADLDQAGTWTQDPGYGAVWMPAGMGRDWAPYRTGHWAWVAPWGWTWIDDAPWGYAPFHYGRWAYLRGGWGWIPGPVVVSVRPVYAPALVAWVGGPSFGVSIGIGGGPAVGWFALGPREVFYPSYGYSRVYIERVNVTNTVIVDRGVFARERVTNVTYVNRGAPGAMVAVRGDAFVSGRRVNEVAVRVRPEAVARVEVVTHAGIAPQREAVLGGRAAVSYRPPAVAMSRTVVTRVAPPPPPVAFAHEQQAIQANGGRPLDRARYEQIRQSSPPPAARVNYRPATVPAVTNPSSPRPSSPVVNPRPEFRENRIPPATTTQPPPVVNPRPEFRENRTPPVTTTQPPPVVNPRPEFRENRTPPVTTTQPPPVVNPRPEFRENRIPPATTTQPPPVNPRPEFRENRIPPVTTTQPPPRVNTQTTPPPQVNTQHTPPPPPPVHNEIKTIHPPERKVEHKNEKETKKP